VRVGDAALTFLLATASLVMLAQQIATAFGTNITVTSPWQETAQQALVNPEKSKTPTRKTTSIINHSAVKFYFA
jgi:hypothetical protein